MTCVAVVTGASGALGTVVSRALSARGYKLALLDTPRSRSRLDELAASLGGNARAIAMDVGHESDWIDAMNAIERDLGSPPSAAALLAGAWRGGKPLHEEADDDVWRTMMVTNVDTVYRSLRALLPPMIQRKRGSIVVVGSRAAVQPWTSAGAAAYATSKAATLALAQSVATEVIEHGVRLNAILPSTLDTPANRASMPGADASKWVSLDAAASVVLFLLSDAARDITGAAVPVYGKS